MTNTNEIRYNSVGHATACKHYWEEYCPEENHTECGCEHTGECNTWLFCKACEAYDFDTRLDEYYESELNRINIMDVE